MDELSSQLQDVSRAFPIDFRYKTSSIRNNDASSLVVLVGVLVVGSFGGEALVVRLWDDNLLISNFLVKFAYKKEPVTDLRTDGQSPI